MLLDLKRRELSLKLVYYGAGLGGKTTNLVALHERLRPAAGDEARKPPLTMLKTADDRTLFFDLLPLRLRGPGSDAAVRLKLYTVPGQPIHAITRRLVLRGADGVAFVADSQISRTRANADSFVELRENLKSNGLDLGRLPLVIQFNKRDLPEVRSDDEIAALAARGREPLYMAVATEGRGVIETFVALLKLTWLTLDREHGIEAALGLTEREVLLGAAAELGVDGGLDELVAAGVGGLHARLQRARA
ncbi:MAG: GTPase domain-containing protein [Deltaproteobacteria bacterium]|nr:GTPase domain-containing protein [Deltaproteobacteria bacterium]